jgi:hypothetical protein
MSPLQLAVAECANYLPDGSCLGATLANDGTIPHGAPKPRCMLATEEPCKYFEQCVLAGIPTIGNERKADEWQEAGDIYKERKRQYEQRGLGKGRMERGGDDGAFGGYEEAAQADDTGRRSSRRSIGARFICLSGRGRSKMARGSKIR